MQIHAGISEVVAGDINTKDFVVISNNVQPDTIGV